jgi:NAD(P)-dependent dehydrogenase (short-subunit alcohol dehydrogenase family)
VIDQARRDLHDMAAALLLHLGDGELKAVSSRPLAITGPLYCYSFIAQRNTAWRLKPLRGRATRSPDSSCCTKSKTLGSIEVSVRRAQRMSTPRVRRPTQIGATSTGRVNQLGCFLGMKAVVSLMEQSGGGSIVNISSVAGLRGSPGAIAYSATKWALRGMTKAAAIDLAPRKIRVNSVHPGPIDTEMLKVRTPEQNQQRLQLVPMKRIGTAEEVASLVLFLLSDESGYITGAEVAIDGGVSL